MQVTIVSVVPLISNAAFWATSVENKGESAIIVNPQKIRNAINRMKGRQKANGDTMQQHPDKKSAAKAVFLVPNFCDRYPLMTQAMPPNAIIKKDKTGIFIFSFGFSVL